MNIFIMTFFCFFLYFSYLFFFKYGKILLEIKLVVKDHCVELDQSFSESQFTHT